MSTGYSWEGIRQVRATLLGARHVPERLYGGYVYTWRAMLSARPLPLYKWPISNGKCCCGSNQ